MWCACAHVDAVMGSVLGTKNKRWHPITGTNVTHENQTCMPLPSPSAPSNHASLRR